MITKLGRILRRIVFAFGVIYGIDVLLNKVGVYMPINIVTISVTTILGIPGLISLFVIYFVIV